MAPPPCGTSGTRRRLAANGALQPVGHCPATASIRRIKTTHIDIQHQQIAGFSCRNRSPGDLHLRCLKISPGMGTDHLNLFLKHRIANAEIFSKGLHIDIKTGDPGTGVAATVSAEPSAGTTRSRFLNTTDVPRSHPGSPRIG